MVFACVLSAGPASARVGVAAAIDPVSDAQPPGLAAMHPLTVGEDINYRERIVTGAAGQVNILFLDRSSLNIGPNAEVVIDRFAYSPADGRGQLAIDMLKGVLRFIGGALSKGPDGVTVKTPDAVIGIRGGIAIIDVSQTGTRAVFLFGRSLTVTGVNGGVARVTRPGFAVDIGRGQGVGNVVRIAPADLAKVSGGHPTTTKAKAAAIHPAPTTFRPIVTTTGIRAKVTAIRAVAAAVVFTPAHNTGAKNGATTLRKAAVIKKKR